MGLLFIGHHRLVFEKAVAEEAEHVVHHRLGDRNLAVVRKTRRLEASVAEFVHQRLERNAVLERDRRHRRNRVHQARDRASFLRHAQEDLARLSVFIEAHRQVTLMTRDGELMGDGAAFVGQLEPYRPLGVTLRLLLVLHARAERLGPLAPVAVHSQRLETQPPAFDVSLGNIVDGGVFGQVDSLADRVEELEGKLNEALENNIDLSSQVKTFEKDEVLGELSSELTDIEVEKLRSLSEGVGFEDTDQYKEALGTIKGNYFPRTAASGQRVMIDEDSEITEEGIVQNAPTSGAMAAYVNVIGRTVVENQ